MDITPTEVVDLSSINLSNEVTKGLVPDQVIALKERIVEINSELESIGQGVRSVAANLYEIKQNIKGNWRAFLKSGVYNCSERNAIDLVSAHEKWLNASDVEDHMLSNLSARSLAIMGSANVTDKQRQKVFEAVSSGEKVTESFVRLLVKGRSNKSPKPMKEPKSVDTRVAELTASCEKYKATIRELLSQNQKLKRQLAEQDRTAKTLDKIFA